MLERVTEANEKLTLLASALRTDAASWSDWTALYFAIPRMVPADKSGACLADIADLLARHLGHAEGFLFAPDPHALITVLQMADYHLMIEAALQATELAQTQTNSTPTYEIYHLEKDAGHFIEMVYNRFGLEQGSPQPWSSPSHLMRFCRDDMPDRHPIHQTLKKSARILLVEDDPVTRWLVRNALKDECELVTASSGNKALHMYQTYNPDLVFLDIGLPDRDGGSVLESILKQDPGARVVMFTHNDNFDTMVDTINRGARGFVTKPFHRGRLLHYINTV